MGRGTSRRKVEQDATEDVGGQLLLSFAFARGLLPVGGSELEHAGLGPGREQAEEIADVTERLDVVEASTGDERDERVLVTAPSSLPTKSQLRRLTTCRPD